MRTGLITRAASTDAIISYSHRMRYAPGTHSRTLSFTATLSDQ